MNGLFQSKPVLIAIAVVALGLSAMTVRVVTRSRSRAAAKAHPTGVAGGTGATDPNAAGSSQQVNPSPSATTPASAPIALTPIAENAAYLDQYYNLEKRNRDDQDVHGVPLTRRKTASTHADAPRNSDAEPPAETVSLATSVAPLVPLRASSRLSGRAASAAGGGSYLTDSGGLLEGKRHTLGPPTGKPRERADNSPDTSTRSTPAKRPQRFNPYGSVLKCELVFAIDSVSEQTPLVGIVMEPVYNNGRLVIPAGTEVHGVARADRTRNRLFSGDQWMFVFPRENGRINGRQLSVRGVALDRIEPDVNGMTWGLGDGAYGLEGTIIRSMNEAEIKRFIATFLASASAGLQTRRSNPNGGETVDATPRNAALAGVTADMQQLASDIAAEIGQHGVYIHIPAGHQFYFYPTQVIDPDAADISTDIATVK